MIELKFGIGGEMFSYEPQPDITAYEAAQLGKLILVSVHAFVPTEDRQEFILKHGLMRHFTPLETSK